ncbi:MAG: sugar phosphate isomerase/epimerase [Gemmataceae bacterium]|nr:sugar phosphate isomerase/epimerase [Gemmataceae bacterium]
MSITRRQWMAATAMLGTATTASAIEPIRRNGRTSFKLGLAAYSFRQALDLRRKPPAMNLEGFIDQAAGWPVDAVELTAYYFPETTPAYLARLKARCTRLGLDISGAAVGNNFCRRDADRMKEEIDSVKRWIEHTSRLGGKTIRIFAGAIERGEEETVARRRAIAAIEECCEHAAQFGVLLALENHGGITATADQLLEIVRAVRSEWFGVNLDSGNFRTADPYDDLAKIAPFAVVAQLKTEIHRQGKGPEEADLKRLVDMLRKIHYRGYVVLEYEAAEDAAVAVPRHLRTLRELLS